MINRWLLALLTVNVIVGQVGCDRVSYGGEISAARSSQASTTDLAAGRLPARPSGSVYLRVVEFAQEAGSAFTSHQHVPGIVYQQMGMQRLVIANGPSFDIGGGEAHFLGSLVHDHLNPEAGPNHWYFIALWPTEARGIPLADASARVAFATPDLPEAVLLPGPYVSTLQLVVVEPSGRTSAHSYGGVELIFILEGSITVRSTAAPPTRLGPAQGIYHLPNTVVQEINDADSEARYLVFLITGEDQPFQTNVTKSP